MAKTALCIGINDYPGTGSDLAGCVNDAKDWKAALEARGFTVRMLLDKQATKDAMAGAMRDLVGSARSGDSVVITFSGHGSFIPDVDGDEPDGRDEVLCPYDIGQNRPLTDDELYDIFAERERGAKIVIISDSCHSGTVARVAPPMAAATAAPLVRFLPPSYFLPAAGVRAARVAAARPFGRSRPSGGVLMAGCKDTEYSYDAQFGGRPNGAFTYVALKALAELATDASYAAWFAAIRQSLPSQNYPQTPQLGGSRSQKAWKVLA